MQIEWRLKKFDALSTYELYAILRLRNEVFVVEQNCVFQDADNKDQHAYHLMGTLDNQLVAYTRIVPAGEIFEEVSIGRVITSAQVRGTGLGKELMERSIKAAWQLFDRQPIRLGAQLYLKKFYESFGFKQISDMFMEDGIEHIYMLKKDAS